MSRQDGALRVVLTGKWWDMIESGEKLEEYRKDDPEKMTWAHRLLTEVVLQGFDKEAYGLLGYALPCHFHPYHTLVASRGYSKRTLTRKIRRIRWGTPRPEWSGDTVTGECFVIELEAHTAQGEHPADRVEETENGRSKISS